MSIASTFAQGPGIVPGPIYEFLRENDTELPLTEVLRFEAWYGRRELVEQLVERITVSRTEDGRAKVHIAYKFAPPVQAASGVTDNKTFEILAGDTPVREALQRI